MEKTKGLCEIINETSKMFGDKPNDRLKCNRAILEQLRGLIEGYPNQRFGQIIANYIFPNYREKDFFYEESRDTLKNFSFPK